MPQGMTALDEDEGPEGRERGSRGLPPLVREALILVAVVIAASAFRAFVAEPYVIPTESMAPTIPVGSVCLGIKGPLWGEGPVRGAVISFVDPRDGKTTLVKRVVATAGDTVDLEDGQLVVNGRVMEEPYTQGVTAQLGGGIQFPYTVPKGELFVMGDNRENSLDSRAFGGVGLNMVDSVIGVRLTPWPPESLSQNREP